MTGEQAAAGTPTVSIGLLGSVTVSINGVAVHPGGPRQRATLAILAASPEPISADALAEAVWSDTDEVGSRTTLQVHVHNIRKLLGAHDRVLRLGPAGYQLVGVQLDVVEAQSLLKRARLAWNGGDSAAAAALFRRALALFRGEFCADLTDMPSLEFHRARWNRERSEAFEALMDVELTLGTSGVASEIEREIEADPLRERLWGQLMIALYRDGRQADALAAYGRARDVLADEAGLDPSAPLRALEAAVLNQAGTTQLLAIAGRAPLSGSSIELLWLDSAGRQRKRAVPAGATLRVGRDPDAEISLAHDGAASRWHAIVGNDGRRLTVTDTASTNGTWVNGDRLAQDSDVRLYSGDLIRCGETMIFIHAPRPHGAAGHDDRTRVV